MALTFSTVQYTTSTRNSIRDHLQSLIDAGTAPIIELREGSTIGSGTLLATIPLDTTAAFTDGADGELVLDVSPVPSDSSADATGTPGNWQLLTQAAGTVILQGLMAGADTINSGSPVNITSLTITVAA
jgi:hypothetical protein